MWPYKKQNVDLIYPPKKQIVDLVYPHKKFNVDLLISPHMLLMDTIWIILCVLNTP